MAEYILKPNKLAAPVEWEEYRVGQRIFIRPKLVCPPERLAETLEALKNAESERNKAAVRAAIEQAEIKRSLGLRAFMPRAIEHSEEPQTLAELERQAILEAVARCKGDKRLAARRLGIGVTTIYAKLARYKWGRAA